MSWLRYLLETLISHKMPYHMWYFVRSELCENSSYLGHRICITKYSTSVPYQKEQVWYRGLYISIADPRCLSRFLDSNFLSRPDPGSRVEKIPDPHQRILIFLT
jgi:hypothetical protein